MTILYECTNCQKLSKKNKQLRQTLKTIALEANDFLHDRSGIEAIVNIKLLAEECKKH